MSDEHHELPTPQQQTTTTPAPDGASCSTGPSHDRSSALASAPGVAEEARHQEAPGRGFVAEGGHEQRQESSAKARRGGRRRTRQPKQRSERQTFRASTAEATEIQEAADAMGISKARFIAQAVHAEIHGRSRLDHGDALDVLEAARIQLVRAGTNLNQIAKVLNSGGDATHIARAVAAVADAATEIRTAARKLVS